MKKKNGFTLVELLAVIAILAMIIVIALPKFNDTLSVNEKNIFVSEVNILSNEVKKHYLNKNMGALNLETATYNVGDGNVSFNEETLDLTNVKGSGYIQISEDGKVKIRIKHESYCAVKDFEDDKIVLYDVDDYICE